MRFPAIVDNIPEIPADFEYGWFNDNVQIIQDKFNLVKHLLMQPVNDENFSQAIEAIHFIIDKIPLMVYRMPAGCPVVRVRPNYGSLFSQKQEISYNISHADKISAGRFNRPAEPLFYGALQSEDERIDPVLQSCLETCKPLADPINPPELQDLTVGIWTSTDLIPVINICFDEQFLIKKPNLKAAVELYRSDMRSLFSEEACNKIFSFMDFFSNLAWSVDNSENCYYILTALFYAMRYYYAHSRNTAIPGVMFPSAMSAGYGINIALVTEAVDRFLTLDKVFMQRFVLVKNEKRFVSYPSSGLAELTGNRFVFRDVSPYSQNGVLFSY